MFFGFLERYYVATLERRFSEIDPIGMITLRSLLVPNVGNIQRALKRYGSKNDGGYLLFNEIGLNTGLLSFGVGDNLDFEEELGPHVNRILAFDGSIDHLPKSVLGLEFRNIFVGDTTSNTTLSINEIIPEMKSERLIMKIDIEGAEWRVLGEMSDVDLERFDQIVGEFHGLASMQSKEELDKIIRVLERLLSQFALVNSHPNNWSPYRVIKGVPMPDAVELTFLRKAIFSNFLANGSNTEFYELNRPCNPIKPEYFI